MPSMNLLISHVATNQNQPEVTLNTAIDELDNAVSRVVNITMTDADWTLPTGEGGEGLARVAYILTGTLTAGRNFIVPTTRQKFYWVKNSTTGGFGVTVKTSGGTGVLVPNGANLIPCYGDGTNVISFVGATGSLAVTAPVLWASVPATSGAAGTAGQVAYDASFLYVCTAPNTWKKVAIATW